VPIVTLGNVSPLQTRRDENDNVVQGRQKGLKQTTTVVQVPDEVSHEDAVKAVLDLWRYHSDKPAAWVECDDEDLQEVLARELQVKAGRPASFKEGKKR